MTTAEARTLAQSDPVPNLTTNLGRHVVDAKTHLQRLQSALRDIDHCRDKLAEHGVSVEADLGPIGNAAAAARRDLETQRDTHTFELPR